MTRWLGIGCSLVLVVVPCLAQDNVDGFAARIYTDRSGQTMPYRLFLPNGYDRAKQYPLILWLHGAGGIGSDNRRQIEDDQVPGTHIWTEAGNQEKHPAFVLVPQATEPWDTTGYLGVMGKQAAKEHGNRLSGELLLVRDILDALRVEFSIDASRLYIAGQSFGGYGTWNFITKEPGLFAAAIILCGGGNSDLAARARNTPIWSFQGDADSAMIVASNRSMIAHIEKAGGKPRYTEYKGVGHDIWTRAFSEPGLVDWLFAQQK